MNHYDVAAVIWPSYHYEPRMEHFWPERDGEWYTVRRGTPRFPGHDMPRIPLLGYQDEADPAVMRQHVSLAREHGINTFMVDWYWYENQPCFERQLNEALIPALEGADSKFFLMWANHDFTTLVDMHTDANDLVMSGQVNRAELESMFDRIIDRYFKLDTYYCINGEPLFCIFEFPNLVGGLGGVEQTQKAFEWMRQRCIEKGLQGLHIQAIARRDGGAGNEAAVHLKGASINETAKALNFDSATSYQFVLDGEGGSGDYVPWANRAMSYWEFHERLYNKFFPNVTIGWDNTHRHPSLKEAIVNTTPDAFETCLWRAKAFCDARPDQPPLITINSWNEWTEGSYLLPDLRWGYRYLRAVRNVFGGA